MRRIKTASKTKTAIANFVPRRIDSWWPFLLILAVFTVYSGVYSHEFLYDDEFLVQKNRFLQSFSHITDIFRTSSTGGFGGVDSFYRPLQGVAYLLVAQLFGIETWAFHLLNIVLHSANSVLIFRLGKKMGLQATTAFCAALIWSVHPLHTETITYISATADSLHTLFMLTALVWMSPDFSWRKIGWSIPLILFALLSKEPAIVFPALMFALIFFFARQKNAQWNWRTYLPTIPFWLISLSYFVSRKTWLNFDNDMSMYKTSNVYTESILTRFYTFLATVPAYLELIVWPHDLHMDRHFFVYTEFLLLPVILGALIATGLLAIGRWRWGAFVGLWILASHVPQSGVLIPVNALFLEHWMYVPMIGISLGVTAGFNGRRFLLPISIFVAIALGIATFNQNDMWKNPISLYTTILKYNPSIDRVRHNLAMAYSEKGDIEAALREYNIVLKNTDQYPQTYHNVGYIYLKQGRIDEAETNFLKAISISPRFYQSYEMLIQIYEQKRDLKKVDEFKAKLQALRRF